MTATLAIAAALTLALAQTGGPKLANVRATYGYLGPIRTDTELLPGDAYHLMFDIEGLKMNETGVVNYKMGMALKNSAGKDQFRQELIDQQALNSLGGVRVPAFAHAVIGADTTPGDYTFEVTVFDPTTELQDTLTRKLKIKQKQLGIVRMNMSYDGRGDLPAPPLAVPGQQLWVNFGVVGFQRDGKTSQPDLTAEMTVLDETGKPTVAKPLYGEANKDVPKEWQGIPMNFYLALNRTGKYKVQVKVTDKLAKNATVTQTFDVTVMEPK